MSSESFITCSYILVYIPNTYCNTYSAYIYIISSIYSTATYNKWRDRATYFLPTCQVHLTLHIVTYLYIYSKNVLCYIHIVLLIVYICSIYSMAIYSKRRYRGTAFLLTCQVHLAIHIVTYLYINIYQTHIGLYTVHIYMCVLYAVYIVQFYIANGETEALPSSRHVKCIWHYI